MIFNDLIFESNLFSVSDFLKKNYNKIFDKPNQKLEQLFVDFTKKFDREKNTSYLYQKFIKSNQTLLQNEINNSESIDEINNIISDEIKYFYFSLKPVITKLQNDEFTIAEIFNNSIDKELKALMSFPEDKFATAVGQYVDHAIEVIKDDAGVEDVEMKDNNDIDQVSERIKINVLRILEADNNDMASNLNLYKKSSIKWLNNSLFEPLKSKFQLLNTIGANVSNVVDQLSKQIKSTQNDNAKKMILNKIVNMDKDELENLALSLGINKEKLGDL